jgi:hypothetical protein
MREIITNFQPMSIRSIMAFFLVMVLLAGLVLPVSAITLTPGTSSGTSTISNGDPVYVTGVATGHPKAGLQVWLVGYNTAKVSTVSVNADNSYKYEITKAETQNLASGQYLVIVQHPMMNGQFDITYSPSTGQVFNRQLQSGGGSSSGSAIFQLTNSGSLQSTDASSALMRAIGSQNVDDTFATASFSISPPNAFIRPVGDHVVGEKFTISGTTNLAVGDKLQVDVYSSSFAPTKKSQNGEFSGASGVVEVMPGTSGSNQWSFDVDASTFRPDEYIVTVAGIIQDVKGSTTFNILAATPVPTTPVQPAMTAQQETKTASAITATPTEGALPVTTHTAVSIWTMLCGLVIGTLIVIFRKF